MSNSGKKVALYCRVSTAQQTTDNQKLRLVRFAEEHGWSYDLFEEVESSRKTRPVKQELLHLLRAGTYDTVVIFKLDRWARSSRELILDTQDILGRGIGFISISDNLDFSTATGKLHFQILSAFAEFERELIRERTIEGLKRTKEQGTKLGRPKGAKDRGKRAKSAYLIREAQKRKAKDSEKGVHLSMEHYLNNPPPNK